MLDHLRILATYYWNPRRAASETLDQARLGLAAVLAVLVALALTAPDYFREKNARFAYESYTMALAQAEPGSPEAVAAQKGLQEIAGTFFERFDDEQDSSPMAELLVVCGLVVPAGIALLTLWRGGRSCSVAVAQEYGSMFLCAAMTWSAAHLPLVPLQFTPWNPWWLAWAAKAVFVGLMGICWFTAMGARPLPAAMTAVATGGILAASGMVTGAFSPFLYMLASPCLLYYFWGSFSGGATAIGAAVSGRQSFRRALEATTINPRDADAHYQLGLLQLARHNLDDAEARFRTAAEIERDDADYAFYLGRVLREKGRHQEALGHLERAARLNDKVAGNDAWREIGAARLALGDPAGALEALRRYVDRREYDPEGLCYFGEALEAVGQKQDARQMFERAVEAARTMPSHRRSEVRPWASRAKARLGGL